MNFSRQVLSPPTSLVCFVQAVEKLREGAYLLGRMRANTEEPDEFRWNLSAFLSAARSVTFYLQKEFSGEEGFEEWYQAKREAMTADEEMRFFTEARVNSIHIRAVSPNAVHHVGIYDSARGSDSIHIDIVQEGEVVDTRDSGSPPAEPPAPRPSESRTSYFFEDFPTEENEVVGACERHLQKLEELVSDWERIVNESPG